jgi:hypothetical protein
VDNLGKSQGVTLLQKQQHFARMVARLIDQADAMGYAVTLGDAYRDPRAHGAQGEKKGYSAAHSAHKHRLAIDLALFRRGEYLRETVQYEPLGLWWEQQGGSWGGRFGDGNHFSLEHGGIK